MTDKKLCREYKTPEYTTSVSLYENKARISIVCGLCCVTSKSIKRNPWTLFGFINVKTFEERIQNTVDKMQLECDKRNIIEDENTKLLNKNGW